MDLTEICRTCLNSETLHPIFLKHSDHSRFSTAIFITTGIKVDLNDGLPQNMCVKCITHINESLNFRKICRDTEVQLKKIKKENGNKAPEPNVTLVDETKLQSLKQKTVILEPTESRVRTCVNINSELKTERNECTDIKYEEMIDNESNLTLKTEYIEEAFDVDDQPLAELLKRESIIEDTEEYNDNIVLYIQKDVTEKLGPKKKKSSKIERKFLKVQHFDDETDLNQDYFGEKSDSIQSGKRITCNYCHQSLSVRSIYAHMASRHPGTDDRRDKCDLCHKYILKHKLNRHKILMHGVYEKGGPTKSFKCCYCKNEFDAKETLIDHVKSCTDKNKKRKVSDKGRQMRECEICHKVMQKASLRMHKAIKHAGLGPVCEHCGKMFGNKLRLSEHCRAKHGYEKFKCTYCEFQSAGLMALRNHERRHRGEKPFICETCGAKFHAAYLLAQHKQSHRTEKLIKCDLCNASFKANNSLHMHKITCHSKCSYRCFLCDKTYTCRHYVVKHLRHFHDYKGKVGQLEKIYQARNICEDRVKICEE